MGGWVGCMQAERHGRRCFHGVVLLAASKDDDVLGRYVYISSSAHESMTSLWDLPERGHDKAC